MGIIHNGKYEGPARELGIPAVVGCGNATLRLKTGDRVLVDGGQGIVEILK
ncbi:MAG: PEP-utilizing enzyme [Tissierellia bacterium]|nr:PEP-utilizing enzyme [Tissierellia bacterium]